MWHSRNIENLFLSLIISCFILNQGLVEKNVEEIFVNKICNKVFSKIFWTWANTYHLPENLKEKVEDFSPLFIADSDLEGYPPDSKCII